MPLHTPVPITITASGLRSGLVWIRSKREPPGTSSVTMQILSSSTTAPKSLRTWGWSSMDRMSISLRNDSIVCWCVITDVRNTFFTATARFCLTQVPLKTWPYAPEASGFGSSRNSFMLSIWYLGWFCPLSPVIIVANCASSPPCCWNASIARFTSSLIWHCAASTGSRRAHFVHRPPNLTRFWKHDSQNVHRHSEFVGITGLLKSWRHTGHSSAPWPLRMHRTIAGVPSLS
mmetsp:Transcript_28170/g.66677  ORF Transcript_28170/g.66677 Transcript_28170/m.66677 type:complete len:232 (-) Transcript_28170:69-764(-)